MKDSGNDEVLRGIDDHRFAAYALAYAEPQGFYMSTEHHVRLFRNGRNQALRIPREFELDADEAIIRQDGSRLIVEPVNRRSLLQVLATLEPIEESLPDVDENQASLDDVAL